ncbi:Cys-tRNA(Pro) deacylase [Ruminococcus sp.]|jgi:Cys-tRNA(Pro)/Cys-tRNA(Cys) deacylase|uniref:Cys-tRNA(Pro) deacylase n=1 Tax=Ruminococcus sp. TaxID=41978 RepID=UPI001B135211|nr:Cys-tRNA(Pro) deacylase [Ruminococcus sp.]MBE6875028.1 Cys-tRNA(Pro) deacylase [Ruminococcus albus]MBO5557291.1 Cys-tRNA(Pro) deacylase [Ruminococcus sp.]
MAKEKDVKTNAMRILDRNKVSYKVNTYECEEFIDGVQIADMLGQPYEMTYKTLVAQGRSGGYFVFVIPIAEELDMKKAARSVGEKSVELIHVKDINKITGYIRGGCTPLGMKKQFPTVVDDTAKALDEIIISGGRLGSQIFLSPKDLVKVTGGKFEQIIFEGQQD